MRSFACQSAIVAALFCLQFSFGSNTEAQEIRKQIGERHGRPIVNYRPDDPWTRGKVFNLQTGYSGLFFNCDEEECKRFSPFICWKPDNEKMLPTPLGLWGQSKQTIEEVKQRIRDGAGDCANNCTCQKCQLARQTQARGYASQNQSSQFGNKFKFLAGNDRPSMRDVAASGSNHEMASAPKYGLISGRTVDENPSPVAAESRQAATGPRYGLISGKINSSNSTAGQTEKVESQAPSSPLRYVAGRNGFDEYFRNRKRR